MARLKSAKDMHRHNRRSDDDDDDHACGWPHAQNLGVSDRHEINVELDKRRDGVEIDIDVERKGRWLEVEIEIGSLDIDFKIDARKLQDDSSPVVAMLGGEGTAIGDQTLVDADIFSRLIDLGSVTVAFGAATFKSTAVSEDGVAFATAQTFADISGADVIVIFSSTVSRFSECDSSFATETSTTRFVAIDFEDFDFAGGPITVSQDASAYLYGGCGGRCHGSQIPQLDGNVSLLDVDALVLGDNTLVDVLSSVLTIEDQLSSVSAITVSAVG